jgi:ketosteroid isomerase-like protein
MTTVVENPIDMSSAFDGRLNGGDIDGLMELLAPGAISRTPQGDVLQDAASIRENLAGMIAAGARLHNTPKQVFSSGDVALLLIDWTLAFNSAPDAPATAGTTANVVVRDTATGSWKLAILNPMGTN